MAEHIRSTDYLHDCLILFSSRAWNSLDSELWRSGDSDAVQQIPQSASGDRGFISKSLDLFDVVERLILLGVAPKSVVFIFFTFSLVALFLPNDRCFLPPNDCCRGCHSVAAVELLACLLLPVP
jgi:hypothetical protein